MQQDRDSNIRDFLISETFRFIARIISLPGVLRIALPGSFPKIQTNPKDTDILITVRDDMDLSPLAAAARKLKGPAQSRNKGADIFLANSEGEYIGRICHWRQCGPRFRVSCDTYHCEQRVYLHDDLGDIQLDPHLVKEPPLEVWPNIVTRGKIADDVLAALVRFQSTQSNL